jgi:flagellin
MSHPPATTSAKTALAAPTPTEQNLNQAENRLSTGDLANMLTDVEIAVGSITTAASTLGETTTNLTTQRTYVSNLSDSLTTGVGSLVDASMNEAATKLATVQIEQHLGVSALRLSDTSTRLILKLFEL